MSFASSLRGAYWPTLIISLMALSPGFILSATLGLLRPTIAEGLGASLGSVFWASILGNAALALGAVLAADLAQRFRNRPLFVTYQGMFIVGSLAGFLAPNSPVLILGHTLQGLATGLLLVAALPPLVTGFPAFRLKTTIPAVVIGLFGAVTAGPLVGGYVAMTGAWRLLFLSTVIIGVATLALALVSLAERPPLNPGARIDAPALLLSAGGAGLSFVGVGALMGSGAGSPAFYVPTSLGMLMLVALVVLEGTRSEALMPVRPLTTAFPLMGILAAIISGAAFTGLLELTLLFLERVRGLNAPAAGFLFWPELVMGIVGAVIVGFVLSTRWVLTMPLFGMASLSLAAWGLTGITDQTGDARILVVAAALGLGASLTVTPGLLMAALSVPPMLVGRAIALVELLRLVSAYTVGPVLLYVARSYGTEGENLLAGLHAGYWIVLGLMLAGMLVITLIYLRGGTRIHPPGLETFLEAGEPAFDSPSVRKRPLTDPG
ncbi:MAG: MFS transporter [Rubrobacteraceae bacterium]